MLCEKSLSISLAGSLRVLQNCNKIITKLFLLQAEINLFASVLVRSLEVLRTSPSSAVSAELFI